MTKYQYLDLRSKIIQRHQAAGIVMAVAMILCGMLAICMLLIICKEINVVSSREMFWNEVGFVVFVAATVAAYWNSHDNYEERKKLVTLLYDCYGKKMEVEDVLGKDEFKILIVP